MSDIHTISTSIITEGLSSIVVDGETIFTADDLRINFNQYVGWSYYIGWQHEDRNAIAVFSQFFGKWVDANKERYKHMYDVLHEEYAPLENYNMVEDFDKQGGNTQGEQHTSTTLGERQTDATAYNSPYGYNASTYSNAEKGTSTATVHSVTDSTNNGARSDTNFEVTHVTRRGNLGVTTSQQMAESELVLRLHNLAKMFVDEFIQQCCFYIG